MIIPELGFQLEPPPNELQEWDAFKQTKTFKFLLLAQKMAIFNLHRNMETKSDTAELIRSQGAIAQARTMIENLESGDLKQLLKTTFELYKLYGKRSS